MIDGVVYTVGNALLAVWHHFERKSMAQQAQHDEAEAIPGREVTMNHPSPPPGYKYNPDPVIIPITVLHLMPGTTETYCEALTFTLEGAIEDHIDFLENAFRDFNVDDPRPGYPTIYRKLGNRSFSVGDVIIINDKVAYRCDNIGWTHMERLPLYLPSTIGARQSRSSIEIQHYLNKLHT